MIMDFKWLGSKVDRYSNNPSLKGCFDFYTSFLYRDKEFHVGEFALFQQDSRFTRIGRLLCLFHSNEGKIKYGGIVRWYAWAKDVLPKMNLLQIEYDEKNEVVEEMSDLDSLVSLTDIQKKCKVFFALLDEPLHLIKEYNLDANVCFSCRYKIENGELVPHFSEKNIKDANSDDYVVGCELDGKFKQKSNIVHVINDSESSAMEQVCSENKTHIEKHSTIINGLSSLIKTTPPKSILHKRKSNYIATSEINLDLEDSYVERDVDKVKSPSNPLKTLRLTPTIHEKKLNGSRLSPIKRHSSVKRVLNDSFDNSITSLSGIPVFCYSIVNSNCDDDDKHIKIKLKVMENEKGMNLKVHPTKLDEEIVQTKSPLKVNDLQQIKNHIVFSPDAKAKILETYSSPIKSSVNTRRNLQCSRQIGSPKIPAKIGLTRRRSSRNVERKSYVEFSSPELSTPKKWARRRSTDSHYSDSVKTPCKDRDAKVVTLSKIDEDENKNKQEIIELQSLSCSTDNQIAACSVLLNKNEVMLNSDPSDNNHPKTSKQRVNQSKTNSKGDIEYKNQTDHNKCGMISSTECKNDDGGVVNKNLIEAILEPHETIGWHGNSKSSEMLPKINATPTGFNVKCKVEGGDANNSDATSNKVVSTSTRKRDTVSCINTIKQSVLVSRPKRNAGTPQRYVNDDDINKKVSTPKQKLKTNQAIIYSDDEAGGSSCNTKTKPINSVGRRRKQQNSVATATCNEESHKRTMRHSKQNVTSEESDDADSDDATNDAVESTPVRSRGRPKNRINSSKTNGSKDEMNNIKSSRPVRRVGRPKKYTNDSDNADSVRSCRSKRSAGARKSYIDSDSSDETEDDVIKLPKKVRSVDRPKKYSSDKNIEIKTPKLKRSVGRPRKYAKTDESDTSDYSTERSKSLTIRNSAIKSFKTPHSSTDNLRKSALKKSSTKLAFEDSDEDDTRRRTPKTPKRGSIMGSPKSILRDTPTARARMIREGIITPSVQARNKAVVKDGTPLSKARTQLHVSFVPKSLPCREKEFADIINFLEGKLLDGCGGCMYVSGVPGTGKTATVTEVIRNLQESVDKGGLPSFKYINVNGMRLSEPRQSYVEIVKQLMGKTVHWEQAQTLLENRFVRSQKKSVPIILVVDELDILCTKRQDVVYNLLDWPTKSNAQLIVITIANTMDLPERLLMGRVTSRLGLTRLTFQAYTHKQLQEIVSKRLSGISAFNPDAIQLVARKVASVSGDARRALDICRRAVEIAELEGKHTLVSMTHVNQALNAMITQPKVQAIKCCSRLEKLILQAVVAEVERTGVEETNFSSVLTMLVAIAALDGFQMVSSTIAMGAVSKLGACRLLLTDQRCNDIYQRIILNVSIDDVYYALNKTEL